MRDRVSLFGDNFKRVLRMSVFAVFLISHRNHKDILVTTRDKGLAVGLPGGKVDPGETAHAACLREAAEEGVDTTNLTEADLTFHHEQRVEGRLVRWYRTNKVLGTLNSYKEKHRGIQAVWMPLDEFIRHQDKDDTYGNVAAISKLR